MIWRGSGVGHDRIPCKGAIAQLGERLLCKQEQWVWRVDRPCGCVWVFEGDLQRVRGWKPDGSRCTKFPPAERNGVFVESNNPGRNP